MHQLHGPRAEALLSRIVSNGLFPPLVSKGGQGHRWKVMGSASASYDSLSPRLPIARFSAGRMTGAGLLLISGKFGGW